MSGPSDDRLYGLIQKRWLIGPGWKYYEKASDHQREGPTVLWEVNRTLINYRSQQVQLLKYGSPN